MRFSVLVLAVTAAGSAAAAEKLMLFPSWGDNPMVATVLAESPDAIIYVVGCPADSEPTACGFAVPIVATQGRFTMRYNWKLIDERGPEYEYNQDNACTLGKGGQTCTWSSDGPYLTHSKFLSQSLPTATTTVLSPTDIARAMVRVTIVEETALIMNYGTDVYGQPTSYNAADPKAEASYNGTVTSKTASPSQTGSAASSAESTSETLESSRTSSAVEVASCVATTVSNRISDAQSTGLSVLAALAFGALCIVGAM